MSKNLFLHPFPQPLSRFCLFIFLIGTCSFIGLNAKAFGGDKKNTSSLFTNNNDGGKDSTKGFKNLLGNDIRFDGDQPRFELNTKVAPFVNGYLAKESDHFEKMKTWAQPYFMLYDKILAQYHIPVELKYLSVIESNLQTNAVSSAGAVGPWQLMPDEAKRFGLKVNNQVDERTDLYKSTVVAAQLLGELYKQYNDWLLVIAAYNCGKGNVNKAISRASGSKNFYDLQAYLPEETRNHVKKYIATHYFFEGGCGWTTLTAKETQEKKDAIAYMQQKADSTAIANTPSFDITGKYNSLVISKVVGFDIDQFNHLNPWFDKTLAEGKTYTIRLPKDKMDIFRAKRQQILYESVQLLLSSTDPKTAIPQSGASTKL